jgi:hypothetical protein
MTTNVPQDVIDQLQAIRQSLQLANDTTDGGISDTLWLIDKPQTVFDAMDALLDQLRAQRQQGVEPLSLLPAVEITDLHRIDRLAKNPKILGDRLYGKWFLRNRDLLLSVAPPQANALVAAAYRKAAEICDAVGEDEEYGHLFSTGAHECENKILSAIPKESADALKEYVSGKCMEVALFIAKFRLDDATFEKNTLRALVNQALEGKS